MSRQNSSLAWSFFPVQPNIGAPGAVANVSSKHDVTGLTKSAALQYATQGIRVNAVAPGYVHTPTPARFIAAHPAAEAAIFSVVPQGRLCEPEEVADAVIFLCSEAASPYGTCHARRRRLDSALSLLECAHL
jgi:NAD(P)-dependent dehydrogenase (short-subunit alcohol dehydrogenase family)